MKAFTHRDSKFELGGFNQYNWQKIGDQGCSGAGMLLSAVPENIFRQNGARVNIAYHSKSVLTITKLPYAQNLADWFSGKSLKLLPPTVRF